MTKADLARSISSRLGHTDDLLSLQYLEAAIESIKAAGMRGENVTIRQWATFEVVTRAPKKARNISANTPMLIPAKRMVRLKLSKSFKARLNRKNITGLE